MLQSLADKGFIVNEGNKSKKSFITPEKRSKT